VTRCGGAFPPSICDLTGLEELRLRGELPFDFFDDVVGDDSHDDVIGDGDDDGSALDRLPEFALPERFGRLRQLRQLRLDCHAGMTHFPSKVRAL
jgi:hypothetical protein